MVRQKEYRHSFFFSIFFRYIKMCFYNDYKITISTFMYIKTYFSNERSYNFRNSLFLPIKRDFQTKTNKFSVTRPAQRGVHTSLTPSRLRPGRDFSVSCAEALPHPAIQLAFLPKFLLHILTAPSALITNRRCLKLLPHHFAQFRLLKYSPPLKIELVFPWKLKQRL